MIGEEVVTLAQMIETYGMAGVVAVLFILIFLLYRSSSKIQAKMSENHKKDLNELGDKITNQTKRFEEILESQRQSYGQVLEDRHEQFISIIKESGHVMDGMSDTHKEMIKLMSEVKAYIDLSSRKK